MEIYKLSEIKMIPSLPAGCIAALGNFDGVHLGHRALLSLARETAKERGASSAVWTFNFPAKAENGVPVLTDKEEKLRLFSECGIDYAVFEDFSLVRNLDCREFVNSVLCDLLHVSGAVCGFNFRFGRGASGDRDILSCLLCERGCTLGVVPPVTAFGEVVSSTAIRGYIETGDVEKAGKMLGRPVSYTGEVVHGKALGRDLGFPTVNQYFASGAAVPMCGVYLSRVTLSDKTVHNALTNVGRRPTVEYFSGVNMETHIPDFSGEIYGQKITVSLISMLRKEMKFSGTDALKEQIEKDLDYARRYFSAELLKNETDN